MDNLQHRFSCPRCEGRHNFAVKRCPDCGRPTAAGAPAGPALVFQALATALLLVPGQALVALIIGYVGAFVIQVVSAGSFEDGASPYGNEASVVFAWEAGMIFCMCAYLFYRRFMDGNEAALLYVSAPAREDMIRLWITAEMAAFVAMGIGWLAYAGAHPR